MVRLVGFVVLFLAMVDLSHSQANQGCTIKTDLGFILDASSSVGRTDFLKQSDFVKNIAEYFDVRSGETQVGVMTMHNQAQVDIRFGDRPDIEIFKRAMDFVPHTGGQRRIDLGLQRAASGLFALSGPARRRVGKVAVVVTYGRQTPAPDVIPLAQAVQPLRKLGVKVIVIGVGTRAVRSELVPIVEREEDLFLVQSYDDLMRQVGRISMKTCSAAKVPEVPKCTERVHVGFLVDSSGSIGQDDFRRELDFVKEIADTFRVGAGESQGAVLSYSTEARMDIRFGQHSTAEDFKRAVDSVTPMNGRTRIDLALRLAANDMFAPNSVRPGIASVAVVLTEGRQTPDPGAISLQQAIQPLRQLGVKVLTVGIGSEVERDELKLLVNNDEDLFMASDFEDLLRRAAEIGKKSCDAVKPSVCTRKADLGFIMDVSGSIGEENHKKQRDFVKSVTKNFKISPQETIVGVVTYSDDAQVGVRLGQPRNLEEFNQEVDRLPYTGGQTRIDLALTLAANDFFTYQGGVRDGMPKVAVVVTDGRQTPSPDAIAAQQAIIPLRQLGVKVFAVGIGVEADPVELGYIVERPDDVFMIADFDKLPDIATEISKKICESANIGPVSPGRPTCEKKADIGFIMDTSQFIDSSGLEKERDFVKAVSESFYLESGESRAALMTYNESARVNVRLGELSPVERFQDAVDSVVHTGGGVRLDRVLTLAATAMSAPGGGVRAGTPKLVVILAGGRQTLEADSVPMEKAVLPLRQMGIHVITVGVGGQVEAQELRLTVERDEDLFLVHSLDQLLGKADEVSKRMCYYTKNALETQKCNKTLDIGFALDSSRSMHVNHFELQKVFINRVAHHLDIGPKKSRIGAIVFSDDARAEVDLSQFRTYEEFTRLVNALNFRGGRTRIDKALRAAASMFSAARLGREKVPQVFILLTDGAQTITPDMVSLNVAVTPLRRAGVKVITVGIGSSVSYGELTTLADTNQDVFLVQSFDQLMTAVELVKDKVCEG